MKRWLGPLVVVVLVAVLIVLAWPRPEVLVNQNADADVCEWGVFSSSSDIPRDAVKATVNRVESGDTLSLDTLTDPDLPARLSGINAPEGDDAAAFLRSLLPEGSTVYTQPGGVPRDQDGNTPLFVWTASGILVNKMLLQARAAQTSFTQGDTTRKAELEAAEASAKDC